jgi:hypothetical protein
MKRIQFTDMTYTEADRRVLRDAQDAGFPSWGAAAAGLLELLDIQRERAASPAWNARAEAIQRKDRLTCAIAALRTCLHITYFEASDPEVNALGNANHQSK